MRRDPALISLSHDHHQALFVAHKLTRASRQTAPEALTTLNAYWSSHGQTHFRAEEEILFPAYAAHADPYDALLAKALCDHVAIRQRIQALHQAPAPDLSLESELGRLIEEHVRLEERKLFPRIEAVLAAPELAAVADALTRATERRPSDDHDATADDVGRQSGILEGMTNELNVFNTTAWERDLGPARGTRLGPAAGAREVGCSLYELDPGAQAVPYHLHYANEELLVVLDGTLELRTPEGVREVRKGAVVAFPAGPDGAHRLRNVSDSRARYLLISTMRFPEVAEQLDTGTVLAMKDPADGWAFPAGSAGNYLALTTEAIKADQ